MNQNQVKDYYFLLSRQLPTSYFQPHTSTSQLNNFAYIQNTPEINFLFINESIRKLIG